MRGDFKQGSIERGRAPEQLTKGKAASAKKPSGIRLSSLVTTERPRSWGCWGCRLPFDGFKTAWWESCVLVNYNLPQSGKRRQVKIILIRLLMISLMTNPNDKLCQMNKLSWQRTSGVLMWGLSCWRMAMKGDVMKQPARGVVVWRVKACSSFFSCSIADRKK